MQTSNRVLSLLLLLFVVVVVSANNNLRQIETKNSALYLPTIEEPHTAYKIARVPIYDQVDVTPAQPRKGLSFTHLFDMKHQPEQRDTRTCFPYKNPEVQNSKLDTCCWYASSTCCDASLADIVIPYIKGNLTKLQQEIGLGDQCYYAVADLVCMICSPNTANFITRTALGNSFQVHICDSFCEKIFSACKPDLAKIPEMPATVKNGEEFCSELFKEAKQNGNIVFDPKVEKSCFDGVPLEQVEGSYCVPGQKKPEDKGLSSGAIAAIVVPIVLGVLLLVAVAGGVGGYIWWKRRQQALQQQQIELSLNSFE